jgi:hypothetical protein
VVPKKPNTAVEWLALLSLIPKVQAQISVYWATDRGVWLFSTAVFKIGHDRFYIQYSAILLYFNTIPHELLKA